MRAVRFGMVGLAAHPPPFLGGGGVTILTAATADRYLTDPASLILDCFVLESGATYAGCVQPWQRALFEAAFATHPDGRPLHRLVYDERRRGESKTEDACAVALADLLTGPPGHRSYAVAGDEDQAGLLLDSARGFVSRSPVLADLVVGRDRVTNPANGAELRVLSSDAPTAFGIRPRLVIFDELSLQRDDRLWIAMWTAIGKRRDARLIGLSMAGWDFASIGWKVRELARSADAYYFHSREGSDPAPWLSAEAMEEQRATLHPADFARFWECRWTEPLGSWITREMYDACCSGVEAFTADGSDRRVGFVDIGLVHDPTTIAVCHMDGDRVVLDTLRTLQGSRTAPVELEVLEELASSLTEAFKVREWVFEAPQAVASSQRLQNRLYGVKVTARYPTVDTQARLFGGLYSLFANRRLVLFEHEQLRREALNLITKTVGGRLKVVDSSSIHQDHVIALGGAADVLMSSRKREIPVYLPVSITGTRGLEAADWRLRRLATSY